MARKTYYAAVRLNYIDIGFVPVATGFTEFADALEYCADRHFMAYDEEGNLCILHTEEYATRLDLLRQGKAMSEMQLSVATGIPFRTVQEYCQGRKPLEKASIVRCLLLAKALGCKVEDLIDKEAWEE